MLGNDMVMRRHVLIRRRQKYALALTFTFWFHDEYFVLLRPLLLLLRLLLILLTVLRPLFLTSRIPFRLRLSLLLGLNSICRLTLSFLLIFLLIGADSIRWCISIGELRFEQVELMWQNERDRKEIVVHWELLSHNHQILAETIFVRHHLDAGPLAYALVRFQLMQNIQGNGQIVPKDVKFFD